MIRSPGKTFRVIATSVRGGRANISFDQALIEARRENRIPDTIRFLRFRPSALIGIHQYLSQEIKLDYCKAHGIDNLYVTDASFFPSIGAVNPTLPIIANSLRVADTIASRLTH